MAKDDLARLERQEQEESDQLASMHADTEEEIFKFGSSQQEDENDGDKSLEQMDDPSGVEDTDEGSEYEEPNPDEATDDVSDGEPEGERRDEPDDRGVPSWRLREETQRREQIERELSELRMRVDAQTIRPAQPPPEVPQTPDMFADPEGYTKHIIERTKQDALRDFRNEYSQRSYTAARARNQAEFDYAYRIAQSRRNDPMFQQDLAGIEASHNPGEAFMAWAEPHLAEFREQRDQERMQEFADVFGVDPPTFRQALAMVNKGTGRPTAARPNVPSLNSATRGGPTRERVDQRGIDGSERSVFDYAFSK
jgi:hypothetical protein